jgi:hypothetical protein
MTLVYPAHAGLKFVSWYSRDDSGEVILRSNERGLYNVDGEVAGHIQSVAVIAYSEPSTVEEIKMLLEENGFSTEGDYFGAYLLDSGSFDGPYVIASFSIAKKGRGLHLQTTAAIPTVAEEEIERRALRCRHLQRNEGVPSKCGIGGVPTTYTIYDLPKDLHGIPYTRTPDAPPAGRKVQEVESPEGYTNTAGIFPTFTSFCRNNPSAAEVVSQLPSHLFADPDKRYLIDSYGGRAVKFGLRYRLLWTTVWEDNVAAPPSGKCTPKRSREERCGDEESTPAKRRKRTRRGSFDD